MSIKVVKAGTHGYYDVFTGNGWRNHTRIRVVKKDTIVLPEGKLFSVDSIDAIKIAIKNGTTKFVNKPKLGEVK